LLPLQAEKILTTKNNITMNELLKNLGVVILLIGVLILAIPAFTDNVTNNILLGGLGVIVVGYLVHIILNKKLE
jgi:hypothetical protein